MSNWNPGSYLIRDFATHLSGLSIYDDQGAPVAFDKVEKNRWSVEAGGSRWLTLEYDVHAGELSVNTSWASPEFVLLNPATLFLYTPTSRGLSQQINLQVPPGLGWAYTTLAEKPDGTGWTATDFDELVDSPIVVSTSRPDSFQQEGHSYHLLHTGGTELWDTAQAAQDLRAIVATTNAFWGQVPLARDYWFFNFLVEQRGGLEHDHGTVMMTSRWQMRKREDYIKWLGLAAHEYFHLWNVRRMRPAALASYDYEHEQYSTELWFAEGFASYYDNLLLSRARLVAPAEYFRQLADDFHRLELTPGRQHISLEQASLDAWIRHYRPNPNSINSTVSYYTKGAVVAFALDTRIRRETDGKKSLDDVMRGMFARWGHTAYPRGAAQDVVEQVAGRELRAWLEPLLTTIAGPDIDEALAYYGLELDRHPSAGAADGDPATTRAELGVNWSSEEERLVIGAIISGMAGSRAGLLPGDELLAIEGERVVRSNLDDRLQRLRPGEEVRLLISRQERLQSLSLELDPARPLNYQILMQADAGRREIRRLESWLGQELQRP